MKKYWKNDNIKKNLFVGAFLITFYIVLNNLSDVADAVTWLFGIFSPFILGGAIAFILNVPISKLEKHMFQKPKYQNEKWAGRRRGLAMVIVILLTLVAIVAIILIIVPELSKTIVNLAQQIPEGIEKLSKWLIKSTKKYPEVSEKIQNFTKNSEKAINTALSFLSSKGSSIISGGFDVITGILSSVTSFFISFIFSIYLLGNKDKLALQAKKVVYAILSEERADKLMRIARLSNRTFGNFISGQCLDAFMLGCEFILVLSILQMPYALLIGILCMLCALIPILGSFIGLAIGALLILLISPIKALIFIIVFTALQQFDANFVYPHVVGSSVGLPGMWVLMSVTVGGSLFGLVGMLILIPVASVLYTIFREHVYKKLAEKDVDPDKYLTVPEKEEGLLESLKKVKIGGKHSEKKEGNADDMIDDDDDDDDGEYDDDDSDDDDEVKSAEEIMEDIKEEIGITPMAKNTGAPAKKRKKR
ncbi:MAG: AI-2E family transporter [Eubacterium sp.]|nr:AI-2E family transporter [Eubacterium sp.]